MSGKAASSRSAAFMSVESSSGDEVEAVTPKTVQVVELSSDSDEDGVIEEDDTTVVKEKIQVDVTVNDEGEQPSDGEITEVPLTVPLTAPTPVVTISSDEDEDGEVDGKAAQRAMISEQMQNAGREVKERDVRYFMMDDVVCSFCGLKGHLAYDCEEEQTKERCHLCGMEGHNSARCPNEICYRCKGTGHISKNCTNPPASHPKMPVRIVAPIRPIRPLCYVCGSREHADCSLLSMPVATLSCYNCGMPGHTGFECPEPKAERWIAVATSLERERRGSKTKTPKAPKNLTGEERQQYVEKKKQEETQKYREELLNRIRNSNRGERDNRDFRDRRGPRQGGGRRDHARREFRPGSRRNPRS